MLLIGAVALAYVILRSCSISNSNANSGAKISLARFAKGGVHRLVTIESPPAMPSTPITGADGELTDLRAVFAQESKLTLVNVWATWCAPCVAELPSLSALAKANPNIRVITISVDRNYEDAAQFLQELGAGNLPLYLDATFAIVGKTGMKATGVPISVFYGASGREIARLAGEADWQSDEANALITHVLAQGAP